MSDNFRGVTFAEQSVTPADDAIVRRAILPDGILTGCEISYSGSTLTMASGYIIACGRTFQHPAAQNWAVVDATSGFARLLLTIDLTKTATKTTFSQIESSIEYAAAEDGFVDLEQSDINLSGSRYQIVACVVSLGTGGITGIVSQMELSRAEGGGVNFSVVGGQTQPAGAKENTIWVNTDQKITGYSLSATEPEAPAEGMVWISIGTFSPVAFNALKTNNITVYPISAKQYVSGAWVAKTAKSYQGGKWVEWLSDGALYYDGDEFTVKTGGWKAVSGTITKNADYFVVNKSSIVSTTNKISTVGYKTITVKALASGGTQWFGFGNSNNSFSVGQTALPTGSIGEVSIDLTGIQGSYYPIFASNDLNTINVYRVVMTK